MIRLLALALLFMTPLMGGAFTLLSTRRHSNHQRLSLPSSPCRQQQFPLIIIAMAQDDNFVGGDRSILDPDLFEDEKDEMLPIAEHFVHAKYQQCARDHGHEQCNQQDIAELLRSLLPPVTQAELEQEVQATLTKILKEPGNTPDKIDEDIFVKAIVANNYWRQAGSLVIKELMYFEALHAYYQTGESLLNNDDYEDLKENLTWEGSSIASMSKKEVMFVHAVASAKRGMPVMDDADYAKLKADLKAEGSWVVSRGQDALEKLGLDTFLGYLHRALA